jgi:hypothetical protein
MTKAPVSIHEAAISRYFTRDRATGAIVKDPALETLHDSVAFGRQAAEQMAAAYDAIMFDQTRTEAQRLVESRKIVATLAEKAAKRLDEARTRAEIALGEIRSKTNAPAPPMTPGEIALDAEVRAALKAMSDKDRGAAIVAAIRDGDDAILRAALTGPEMLLGMGKAQREAYRHQWRQARHPNETDREHRIAKAMAASELAGRSLISFVGSLSENPKAKLAQSAADRAEAAKAAATAGDAA